MQKNKFIKGLIAALMLASPIVGAVTYPPAFEPSVIYQDKDYIAKQPQTAPAPAAAAPAKPAPADHTKYPSEFKAEVLYQDASAIAKSSAPVVSRSTSEPVVSTSGAVTNGESKAAAESPLAENLPILGIVLGFAAIVIFASKRGSKKAPAGAEASAAPAAATVVIPGETGVARYLKSIGAGAETGVARYLKNLPAAAAAAAETGVAKYLKNLPSTATAAAETGVAKYLKKVDTSAG